MQQRHPNCRQSRCPVCLEDCEALGQHLEEQTGNHKVDHLGRYELFLRRDLHITTETEYGWPTAACFDDTNIAKYIAYMAENENIRKSIYFDNAK